MMLVVTLIAATLAVARVTRFLVEDRLALPYRRWAVNRFGEDGLISYLVHCPWCTSIYVATPVMPAAVLWPNHWVLMAYAIPAASMVAGLLVDKD